MRYYGSVLTAEHTPKGASFADVVNVCVIYIAKFDLFEDGRSVYHVDRIVRETGKVVYNGMEEVYVNAEARDGTEVAELMQVFTEGPVYNDKFPVTSGLKKLYRDGDDEMIYTLSDKLREEGRDKERARIVLNMLESGISAEQIVKLTGIDQSTVAAIKNNLQVQQ